MFNRWASLRRVTHCLVPVVDPAINDADDGALALDVGFVELVDACHVVDGVVAKLRLAAQALDQGLAERQPAGLPGFGHDGLVLDRVDRALRCLDGAASEKAVVKHLDDVDAVFLAQGIDRGRNVGFLKGRQQTDLASTQCSTLTASNSTI